MSNPPKIRIVCSYCRSESVTRDANASWNPDTQDWELEGVMDAAYCNDCGGECSLEEVPYRPPAGRQGVTDRLRGCGCGIRCMDKRHAVPACAGRRWT